MKEDEFKSTWQKVRVKVGDDSDLKDWSSFRGRVKLDPEDDRKLLLEKEFVGHTKVDKRSRIAKAFVPDKETKVKKLIVTVCQSPSEEKAEVVLHQNRKAAEAFLSDAEDEAGCELPNLIFNWTPAKEVLEAWPEGEGAKRLFELGWSVNDDHHDDLMAAVKENFMGKMSENLNVAVRRGQLKSGHEFFMMQLVDQQSSVSMEDISGFFEDYTFENDLLPEKGIVVNEETFEWKVKNKELLFDIFMNKYMNVVDTDDLEHRDDHEEIVNSLKKAFLASEGVIMDSIDGESMSEQSPSTSVRKDRIYDQGKAVGGALVEGVAMAAADQGGELLLDLAQKFAPKMPYINTLLDSDEGREFLKMFLAMMIHTTAYQTELIGEGRIRDLVIKASEQQLKLSSYKIIGPQLAVLRKFALSFAENGEALESIEKMAAGQASLEEMLGGADEEEIEIVELQAVTADEVMNG